MTQKFLLVLLTLTILLLPHSAGAQTLNNSGLEGQYQPLTECANIQGEVAPGWEDNTCWDGSAEVIYGKETDTQHGGSAAQRIEVINGRVQFAQWINFASSRIYTVRLWLRAAESLPIEILLRKADAPYTTYSNIQTTLSSDWQQVTLRGLAADEAGYLMFIVTTPGVFWVDDVELSSTPNITNLPDAAIPRSFFGMHIHAAELAWPATQQRIGAIRLWDAGNAQWAEVNPSKGVYLWSALDAHVERALANRAELVYNLGRTPRWASARPNEASPYGIGQAAEPADDEDWQTWVRTVGKRYRGKIHYWEIWNEPNDSNFYSGTPETLVRLAEKAYAILKQIDPTNRIVSPSPYTIDYLDRYLELGGDKVSDIIGYHFYVDDQPEVLFTSYVSNVRLTLEKHGILHKPLWNTEEGWLRPTPFGPMTLSDSVAASYVARAYILNWASGVNRFYYYAWDNHDYMDINLTTSDSITLTPAGVAYREIARWLIGNQMTNLEQDADGNWIAMLVRPDGSMAYIIWNPTESRSFTIPSEWQVVSQWDLSGKFTPLVGNREIVVDGSPLLLEERAKGTFLPLLQRTLFGTHH